MDLSAKVNVNFATVDVFFFSNGYQDLIPHQPPYFFTCRYVKTYGVGRGQKKKKKKILNTEVPLLIHDTPYKISTKYTEPF